MAFAPNGLSRPRFSTLISLIAMIGFIASCTGFKAADLASAVALPTVAVDAPTATPAVSWAYQPSGTCSENGAVVQIRNDSGALLASTTCASNAWKFSLDLSTLPVGQQNLNVVLISETGLSSVVATQTINKTTTKCDSATMRARSGASGFAGGTGTPLDPYIICTADQLQALGILNTNNYLLQSNIDLGSGDTNGDGVVNGSDSNYITGAGWTPVDGTGTFSTDSIIDGGGFEIRNLKVNRPGVLVGLFSSLDGRVLKNLALTNVDVSGDESGGLTRHCNGSIFLDVIVTGKVVSVNGPAGGICSRGNVIISRSKFKGTVTSNDIAGGMLGGVELGFVIISESSSDTDVTGNTSVGGFIGNAAAANPNVVINSFSSGTIKGNREVGGLIGSYGTIWNSYSVANIVGTSSTPNSYFGGLGGFGPAVYNSFFAGNVNAGVSGDFSPLSPYLPINVNNHYWSGGTCTGGVGSCAVYGTGHADLNFFKIPSNAPITSWDFAATAADGPDDAWSAAAGSYPVPWWQSAGVSATVPFSGLGTVASPYLINTVADFQKMGSNMRYLGANFRLMADLDLTSSTMKPIAKNLAFFGGFDGNAHTISNYTYSDASTAHAGLFGTVIYSTIQNLKLTNFTITGGASTGGLVGTAHSSHVMKVRVTGSVTGADGTGGIVGSSDQTWIERNTSSASVHGGYDSGGIVGQQGQSRVENNASTGSVAGLDRVGGIAGSMYYGLLQKNYSTGAIAGGDQVGGIVGYRVGDTNTPTQNCFTTSSVTGSSTATLVGPIIGDYTDLANSTGNFANVGASCTNSGTGATCNANVLNTQATAAAFYDPATAPLTTWDFTTIWLSRLGTSQFPDLR